MKKVTIKDIARIAGVSRGTVDRVINNRGNVNPSIEQTVLKIAEQLGYEKNLMASNLAYQRTYKIAVITPDPDSDPFWAIPKEGIENALTMVKHYGLSVNYFHFFHNDATAFGIQCNNALASNPDAIILAPVFTQESAAFMDEMGKSNIPIVSINTEIKHAKIAAYIGQNSLHSGYLAGRLLHLRLRPNDEVLVLNFGHDLSNASHYSDKLKGIMNYFTQHELTTNYVHWYQFEKYADSDAMRDFFTNMINKHPNTKAIFFTNSRAYRLLNVIEESQLKNIYSVGFDMVSQNIVHLKSGKLDFLINQNPKLQGYNSIMTVVNMLVFNKAIKQQQYLPLDIVIKENVDFYLESN